MSTSEVRHTSPPAYLHICTPACLTPFHLHLPAPTCSLGLFSSVRCPALGLLAAPPRATAGLQLLTGLPDLLPWPLLAAAAVDGKDKVACYYAYQDGEQVSCGPLVPCSSGCPGAGWAPCASRTARRQCLSRSSPPAAPHTYVWISTRFAIRLKLLTPRSPSIMQAGTEAPLTRRSYWLLTEGGPGATVLVHYLNCPKASPPRPAAAATAAASSSSTEVAAPVVPVPLRPIARIPTPPQVRVGSCAPAWMYTLGAGWALCST